MWRSVLAVCVGVCLAACGADDVRIEGTNPGDCEDGADNDADSLFDCDDPSCSGAPVCRSMPDAGIDAGDSRMYGYAEWRLRCEETAGCTAYPDRVVDGFDGDFDTSGAPTRIMCSVSETSMVRTLSFMLQNGPATLQVQNARIERGASSASDGTGCELFVHDDNAYSGACGGSPPCTISDVSFGRDEDDARPLITGRIYCTGLRASASVPIVRELSAPGTSLEARTSPMTFYIWNCPGYTPD